MSATKIVRTHISKALSGLPKSASDFEKAAAINAYIFLYLKRTNGATANSATEVLESGQAVCGGMTMAMREMLKYSKISSKYAFTFGGLAAHSMVEAKFSDGSSGLFDPYHGLLYFDAKKQVPVSLLKLEKFIAKNDTPIQYLDRSLDISSPLIFKDIYSETPMTEIVDFDFPEIFTKADGIGIANSGFVSFVNIDLKPGQSVGNKDWAEPTDTEPKPWSALSVWERGEGDRLSWAYILGQINVGYIIQHTYTLTGLVPGQRYELLLKIANAYPNKNKDNLALTMHPVYPFGRSKYIDLQPRGYNGKKKYRPQLSSIKLIASKETMVVNVVASGDIVLQSSELIAQ